MMMSTKGHGPQSPANEGAKISETPTQSVDSQGGLGGNATCDRSQSWYYSKTGRNDMGTCSEKETLTG